MEQKADAAATTELPAVEVSALREPVEKSYRRIVKGMDLFEQRRSLAPDAPLRFRLLPRGRGTNMQGITLDIIGDTVKIPVPVAPDDTFALERSQRALDEDAVVIPNRRARSMTWRTDIRTPGLPPNTRRLGDLRLECLVGIEADLVSNVRPFFGQLANLFFGTQGYCNRREVHYLFFAERPLFSVTLIAGKRREVLSIDKLYAGITRDPMSPSDLDYCDCEVLLDRTYYAPLSDPSWPDDTLLELEYMDDGGARAVSAPPRAVRGAEVSSLRAKVIAPGGVRDVAAGRSTRADVIAALGETEVIGFEGGHEVWVYRLAGDTARTASERAGADATSEFVILLAPSGLVTKTRVRPPPRRSLNESDS